MAKFGLGAAALLACALAVLGLAMPAAAGIRIDSAAARATLAAVARPDLTRADAFVVADLPGNRAIVRKLQEFGQSATRETFADALVAVAHGQTADSSYGFLRAQRMHDTALKLLNRIDAEPAEFQVWIAARIAPFTPKDVAVEATGYLIAGGSADGFSFDEPAFFMDITKFADDFGSARVIMAHELFHAVQNIAQARTLAATGVDAVQEFKRGRYDALAPGQARACYATRAIFGSLMAEGTASYVGDAALLPEKGAYADAERGRAASRGSLRNQATLLEMAMVAITGPDPVPPQDVYSVGFYDNAPLYGIGYVMAKAIAAHEGDAALGRLIGQPGDAFVRDYAALKPSPGERLPKLGAHTMRWASRRDCPEDPPAHASTPN